MRSFRLTPLAREDLIDIRDHIAQDNPEAADRILECLEAAMKALVSSPGIGRARVELGQDLRSFPVGKYIIYYRAKSFGISVDRVLHGARDVRSLFEDHPR